MEHRVGATMQSTGMRAARQRIVAREPSTEAGNLGLITCPDPSFVAAVPDGLGRGLSRAIAGAFASTETWQRSLELQTTGLAYRRRG